ncbi:MAG: sigma-54 dependent transcriptional regulator [bacterium]|nr:sigma-54 dependent transcriptional regulator [Candidatus Sumerlaeota bacterium]
MAGLNAPGTRHILIVDDDFELVRILQAVLKQIGTEIRVANTGRRALQMVTDEPPAVMLLDMRLPDISGMEVLNHIRSTGGLTTVIVMTAHGSVDIAVEAMRQGAYDFLTKPLDNKRLVIMVRNALERHELIEQLEDFRRHYEGTQFHGMRGSSPPMQRIYQIIRNSAPGSMPVFISGEPGTGKRMCAHGIHAESGRRANPFVILGLEDVPPGEIETRLFGSANEPGLLMEADQGTLFISEICAVPLQVQARLMRFLQTNEVSINGQETDTRIFAATSANPKTEISQQRLDEDFFYRMHVVSIHMPPLRDRGEDILDLAEHFLRSISSEEGKSFKYLSDDAEIAIFAYSWPGNVRELRDAMAYAVKNFNAETLEPIMLPKVVEEAGAASQVRTVRRKETVSDLTAKKLVQPLWKVERENIERAIELSEGSIPDAARLLEISPTTIYRKQRMWKAREA